MQFLQYYGVDWLATACGLLGVFLLGNKNKIGFVMYMIASLSWLVFGILTNSIAMTIGSSIFLTLHLRGFLKWIKVERLNP
jgi:hypothetical protein